MKTIIAGSRHINSKQIVQDAIDSCPWRDEISEVVCGGANGVDRQGSWWAERNHIAIKDFPADWKTYGKSAGPIRNHQMAQYADALILVWDGTSKGSADMKRWAEHMQLRIYEVITR